MFQYVSYDSSHDYRGFLALKSQKNTVLKSHDPGPPMPSEAEFKNSLLENRQNKASNPSVHSYSPLPTPFPLLETKKIVLLEAEAPL